MKLKKQIIILSHGLKKDGKNNKARKHNNVQK